MQAAFDRNQPERSPALSGLNNHEKIFIDTFFRRHAPFLLLVLGY